MIESIAKGSGYCIDARGLNGSCPLPRPTPSELDAERVSAVYARPAVVSPQLEDRVSDPDLEGSRGTTDTFSWMPTWHRNRPTLHYLRNTRDLSLFAILPLNATITVWNSFPC